MISIDFTLSANFVKASHWPKLLCNKAQFLKEKQLKYVLNFLMSLVNVTGIIYFIQI